jgi:hypothetical protein
MGHDMNISFDRITHNSETINRPRLAGKTRTRPVLPCDLPDASHDLETDPFMWSFGRSPFLQAVIDLFAMLFWAALGLISGLGVFLAAFFLLRG